MRNQVLVDALAGYDMSNAASWVPDITLVTRHDMNVGVHHCLPRMNSAIYSDIESIWIMLFLENVLKIPGESKAGNINRTRKFEHRLDVNFGYD